MEKRNIAQGKPVVIIGAGLAGSEAALQIAHRGIAVELHEMRPEKGTPVHRTGLAAELVCSNSLKSMKPQSAAGMQKHELDRLGSFLYRQAKADAVPAGGALAVDRDKFARHVTAALESNPYIALVRGEATSVEALASDAAAVIVASGPLTSDALAADISRLASEDSLAFFDAAAPIVTAESLDMDKVFRQSRYEDASDEQGAEQGDYLNAPFDKRQYEAFIDELVRADRTILREFETRDLFQACQPIEEIARKGADAPRFGTLKPVGLTDPRTGRRPWAALQLRAENAERTAYNLVGFQTNLKFGEQERVFRMIPGLEHAEFVRFGVMHRNTFLNAPHLLDPSLRLRTPQADQLAAPVFIAGQLAGTEGYCEAIRSGLHAALSVAAELGGLKPIALPRETAFGALIAYATNPETVDYQPMHVNFGIMPPLEKPRRNKRERYEAYADRGAAALEEYAEALTRAGLLDDAFDGGEMR